MRTWLEVDLKQIGKNLDTVKNTLPKDCDVIAIVKANAYGHGDVEVAKYLEEYGIKIFAVASLDEALRLRKEGIKGDVLILSYIDAADVETAIDNDITISIISPEHILAVSKQSQVVGKTVKAHLALNTGMNRVGFECKTFKQLMVIAGAYQVPNIKFTGIFSHFSSADDLSTGAEPYTKLQLERFEKVVAYLNERGINSGLKHISNSGAIGKYKNARFDAVRCGALMYGYNTAFDAKLDVKPVAMLKTKVSTVRTIDFGDAVSYSRKFVANSPTKIATLCIGYADGLPRELTNKGTVIINGVKCKSVGAICMDQMMVDVSNVTTPINMGQEAILIGYSEDYPEVIQTADDLAEAAGTCMHDVLSTIGVRVERVYKR